MEYVTLVKIDMVDGQWTVLVTKRGRVLVTVPFDSYARANEYARNLVKARPDYIRGRVRKMAN